MIWVIGDRSIKRAIGDCWCSELSILVPLNPLYFDNYPRDWVIIHVQLVVWESLQTATIAGTPWQMLMARATAIWRLCHDSSLILNKSNIRIRMKGLPLLMLPAHYHISWMDRHYHQWLWTVNAMPLLTCLGFKNTIWVCFVCDLKIILKLFPTFTLELLKNLTKSRITINKFKVWDPGVRTLELVQLERFIVEVETFH